jgi:eukaryotic-like serine/threonine-protein kinase
VSRRKLKPSDFIEEDAGMNMKLTQAKRTIQAFFILIGLFLLWGCSTSSDSMSSEPPSMFHVDAAHLGVYNAPAVRTLPAVKWKFKADGYIVTSPALAGDLLYFGGEDGNLYAVERETGAEKWRFATEGPVRSSPAVVGGLVYFQSNDGFVYALNALTGKQKWKADTGLPLPNRFLDYDYLSSSPAISDGVLYIGGADGNLYALNSRTGKQVWMTPSFTTPVRTSPAVANGVVYFTAENHLLALDATSGEEKWAFESSMLARSSPTIHDGLVYFGDNDSTIYAVDVATGEERWQYRINFNWAVSTAAVSDGVVYIGGDDSLLNALDAATGEVKWHFKTRGETIWSSPAVVNGVLYVGDWNFKNTQNEAGRTAWGYLYGVDMLTGEKLWEFETGGNIVSSPVVDENGVIYFGSLDGYLYALAGQ